MTHPRAPSARRRLSRLIGGGGRIAVLLVLARSPSADDHPRLFFDTADIPVIRNRLENTEFGREIKGIMDTELARGEAEGFGEDYPRTAFTSGHGMWCAAHAFRYLLYRDPHDLERVEYLHRCITTNEPEKVDWRGMSWQMHKIGMAIAYDMVADVAPQGLRDKLLNYAKEIAKPGSKPYDRRSYKEEPGDMGHASAALMACLALKGDVEDEWVDPLLQRASAHVDTYLVTVGDAFWDSDWSTFDQMADVVTLVFPAYRRVMGKPIPHGAYVDRYPEICLMTDGWHTITSDGWQSHRWPPTIAPLTPARLRPVLKWQMDSKYHGVKFPIHAIPAVLHYPYDVPPKTPGEVLGKVLYAKDGGIVLKSGYDVENDVTVIVDFRTRNSSPVSAGGIHIKDYGMHGGPAHWVGGHHLPCGWNATAQYDDDWRGGAPKVPRIEGAIPLQGAKVSHLSWDEKTGSGIVSMVLDKWAEGLHTHNWCCQMWKPTDTTDLGISVLRSVAVDYSRASGCDALIAVADRFIGAGNRFTGAQFGRGSGSIRCFLEGHGPLPDAGDWTWERRQSERDWQRVIQLKDSSQVYAVPGNSYVLYSGDVDDDLTKDNYDSGTTRNMKVTYVSPADVTLTKFGNKNKNGDMKVTGTIGNDGGYFMIATMRRGKGLDPEIISGSGLDTKVKVGGQTVSFDGQKIVLGTYHGVERQADYPLSVGQARPARHGISRSMSSAPGSAHIYDLRGRMLGRLPAAIARRASPGVYLRGPAVGDGGACEKHLIPGGQRGGAK